MVDLPNKPGVSKGLARQPGEMRMKRTVQMGMRGFTLIEMLVVLVIIGLIAGLVGPRIINAGDHAHVQTAETQVKMLRSQLETMHLDIGRFPTAEEGLNLLVTAPTDPKIAARWRGPYLEDPHVPADPWGNPYQYSIPGAEGAPFALYSFGADGQPGGEGDNADIGILPPH
jgi:general secretion pathway protein G